MQRAPRFSSYGLCCLLALLLAALASGCGWSLYTVKVNGYAEPLAGQTLAPGASLSVVLDPKAANPILERQVGTKLSFALNNSGWSVVSGGNTDLKLTFSYGRRQGIETKTRVVEEPGRPVVVTSRDEKGRLVTTEVDTPPRTRYLQEQVTVYDLWLKVRVSRIEDGEVVWIGEATTRSTAGDLRPVLNYLIAGLIKVFGLDTGHQRRFVISTDDPVVQLLYSADPSRG